MANLSKLDETINDLEKQAEMLRKNNSVLAKVGELSNFIEKTATELAIANQNFNVTKKAIQDSLQQLNKTVSDLETQNEKYIEVIVAENKKFLRELSDDVSSKVTRFSSDIQVTIRQEKTYLQEALQNNIIIHFNNLELKQKDFFAQQAKQISVLKILLIVIILLSIGLGTKLFLS